MPVKAMVEYERRTTRDTVDYCNTHGEGCKKHRYPHPKIWGHRNTGFGGKILPGWFMTPDESLDAELSHAANMLDLLGHMPEREFLARPCKVKQMPIAEYWKRFGNRSTEVDMELARLLGQDMREQHTQDVREGYGDAGPDSRRWNE
ncbi:hypothetical protein [Streptomyces sp. NPDC127039]|uniref:hypothetical protein n=1 Tax=Streptomyces sp. NPDC127039 TaxID=3347115 RepID=UPI00366A1BA9